MVMVAVISGGYFVMARWVGCPVAALLSVRGTGAAHRAVLWPVMVSAHRAVVWPVVASAHRAVV